MMKRFSMAAVVMASLVSLCVSSVVHAADKVALVSLQRALNEVNDGKKAKDALKRDFDAKKKKIDLMKADLEKLSQDLDKQKSVLSGEALQQKKQDLQAKFLDLQNQAVTYERDLKTQESESAQKILTTLRQMVLDMSKTDGYTMVIENSSETVLYSTVAVDITDKLISAYNAKSGGK